MSDSQDNQGVTPNPNGETPEGGGANQASLTFDGWLGSQADEVKTLITSHVAGLKSALDSERKQRNELTKSLKDATKDMEAGTKAREALEGLTSRMEEQEAQLAFYDTATAAGITNLKLAWIAAREADAIDKRGNVNLETLKQAYPELFKKPVPPPGNAGAGQGNGLPGKKDMNNFIRAAAGRQT